jgi:hypothetical protein
VKNTHKRKEFGKIDLEKKKEKTQKKDEIKRKREVLLHKPIGHGSFITQVHQIYQEMTGFSIPKDLLVKNTKT